MITAPLFALFAACTYEEPFQIENLSGTVVVPRAAATREIVDPDGVVQPPLTDSRFIGPIYLGLYASMLGPNEVASYPHPEVGPQIGDVQSDAYPYGGTTVGDLRFACFEALSCKVVSDRFVDFDDVVSFFKDTLYLPFEDAAGEVVESGDLMRHTCYDLLEVYTDEEVNLTASDENEDGKIDDLDLQFQENADGDFAAEFTIWQQEMVYDNDDVENDAAAFSLWAFADQPSATEFNFVTCDDSNGAGLFIGEYAEEYYGGRVRQDVLNVPSNYITGGDYVASEAFVWENADDRPVITLDWEVL